MREGNNLDDVVRKQVEEIMRKLDLQQIGNIRMADFLRLILGNAGLYETKEALKENQDALIRKFVETRFPDAFAEELFRKAYEVFPTREMKTRWIKQ